MKTAAAIVLCAAPLWLGCGSAKPSAPASDAPAAASTGTSSSPAPAEAEARAALAGILGTVENAGKERGDRAARGATDDAYAPFAGDPAAVRIPLVEGLTIVTALAEAAGDYESIKRIQSVDDSTVALSYTADHPTDVKASRIVRREDLRDARQYARWFSTSLSGVLPGSTAIGVSSAVLRDLLAGTDAEFHVAPSTTDTPARGRLTRVEPAPVAIPMLVNDQRVVLPAIHARGRFAGDDGDFYFLADAENPLTLRFRIGDDRLTVVKIAYPEPKADAAAPAENAAAPRIERALEATGRAEIYGLYFDFASARIKEESRPVLDAIADVMTKNAAWKLSVEGHTDNVGGDAYNLELSRKRADAVKDALVTSYQIAAGRLITAGFGAGRPKDTNDTLEGRARNRRVELVRQ
jgi:outer membrane protein OmpA-like peptidoglycan-associated protein